MIRKFLLFSMSVAGVALAQAKVTTPPVFKVGSVLTCPAGTHQFGAPTGGTSRMGCAKMGADGSQVSHGPMVSFYNSGKVEAVGQYENGLQTGKWTFFTEEGVYVGETEFAKGEYHGRRVGYLVDGRIRLDENWVNGKRQGPQKSFDANGLATVTEYRDDRPVQK